MSYYISKTVDGPFDRIVADVIERLKAQGFGVLTEIDVQATLKAKLGEEMENYLILGACNPPLAHRALSADRQIGLLLPCNVVVRSADGETIVEALDPMTMVVITEEDKLNPVATEAAARLRKALDSLPGTR